MPGKRKSLRGVDGMDMLSTERPERREMTAAKIVPGETVCWKRGRKPF